MPYCTADQVREYAVQADSDEEFTELITAATALVNGELASTFNTSLFEDPPHAIIQTITAKIVASEFISTRYAQATTELHELAVRLMEQALERLADIVANPYKLEGVDPLEPDDLEDQMDANAVLLSDGAADANRFAGSDPRDWK